jgi:hypothetical protein
VPVFDQLGRPIAEAFADLEPGNFQNGHAAVLQFAAQKPCGRVEQNPGVLAILLSVLKVPLVYAADCPTCIPVIEQCGGHWMTNAGTTCFQGCGGSLRPAYISTPGIGDFNRGYCYSGGTACGDCNCQEMGCTHS